MLIHIIIYTHKQTDHHFVRACVYYTIRFIIKAQQKTQEKNAKPKHQRTLKIINVNCQSLRNKPELLPNVADSTKHDIIIRTESWLTNEVNDYDVFPEGYRMSTVRRDRQDLPQYDDSRTAGVCVQIKDDIIVVHQVSIETDCKIVWVKFDIMGTKTVNVAAYYHPNEKTMSM